MYSLRCFSPASSARLTLICLAVLALFFSASGCGGDFAGRSAAPPVAAINGVVQGGEQPVSGSTVQLYAASTSGYGAAATSLLNTSVTTDANGNFSITGDYTCPSASTQVYLVATGGNPGLAPGTNNSALALMAGLGACGNLSDNTFVTISELTTVGTVWPLAPFMSAGGGANLGTSSTNVQGLTNAFATINNLVSTYGEYVPGPNLPTGTPGATVPWREIYTLADILASCVDSDGTTGECSALFAAATPNGGTAPTNTIDAALDIAQNPANNVSSLYNLVTGTAPFQPALSSAPTDWTVAIAYGASGQEGIAVDASGNVWAEDVDDSFVEEFSSTGVEMQGWYGLSGGMEAPISVAVDGSGNVWTANYYLETGNSVSEFSSSGTAISPSTGYTGGGLNAPAYIAFDPSGNAWVTNSAWGANSLTELSSNGTALSPSTGYTGGGLYRPWGIAVDASGNVWVANAECGLSPTTSGISEFSSSGVAISPSTGYTGGGLSGPCSIAIDASGNIWVVNSNGSLSKFSSSGVPISPPTGYTGGGLNERVYPGIGLAIDGSGNVWVADWNEYGAGVIVSEFSSSGVAISPSTGYLGGAGSPATSIAVDASGNVWVGSNASGTGQGLTVFVGAAAPVVTPLALAVKNNKLGQRP